MKMKKILALLLIAVLACTAAGCSAQNTEPESSAAEETSEPKVLSAAASFAYSSLDAHKEYYGWFSCLYGITENLFKLEDDFSIQPWLAKSGTVDGNIWTIELTEGVTFSNGTPLTAEMVIRNLQRAAEVNERFAYLSDFTYDAQSETVFTITTPEPYPTMLGSLACPELGIMDLDGTPNFDSQIVGTGPFVIENFIPEGDVTVAKNESYWNGEVKLDGAVFHYMQDDASRLMAMQNGELDCDNGVTAAAMEVFQQSPNEYDLTSVAATRLQFYILNQNTLSDNVRRAINLTVDPEAMAAYLSGTVTPTAGPFSAAAAYGKAEKPDVDPEAAKVLLTEEGYTLNAEGFMEKDGEVLTVNIAYYAARSLDTLATLMQEELAGIGIKSELTCEEDPDATYIATSDFDIALYCMIADQTGDPEYFITSTLQEGSYFDVGGFDSDECEALIGQLRTEMDAEKRAELANQIVQISIDEDALGYIALFNKMTVMRKGVTGFAETSPFDFYGLSADTDME